MKKKKFYYSFFKKFLGCHFFPQAKIKNFFPEISIFYQRKYFNNSLSCLLEIPQYNQAEIPVP